MMQRIVAVAMSPACFHPRTPFVGEIAIVIGKENDHRAHAPKS
jgi:hypothetical protein